MNASSTNALALRDPWALVPSLGTSTPTSAPSTGSRADAGRRDRFARRLRDHDDLDAAGSAGAVAPAPRGLVSRSYLGYGLPHGDLIQEGNIGLMKAVKRFDPDQGVRLVSFAMHWIKAEIHEYILKNWRMVKVATTKAQRKLFFNLRSHEAEPQGRRRRRGHPPLDADAGRGRHARQDLNVKREEVLEMETRLSGGDVALEPHERRRRGKLRADRLPGRRRAGADAGDRARKRDWLATDGIALALDALDARSRRIVEERWLKVNDDSSGGMTLHDLADEYGVSAERIRQIEVAAMKKMTKALADARDAAL